MPEVAEVKPASIRELWGYLLDVHTDVPCSQNHRDATQNDELDTNDACWQKKRSSVLEHRLRSSAKWPPDVFCLAAAALKQSGDYINLDPQEMGGLHDAARKAGMIWRTEAVSGESLSETKATKAIVVDLGLLSGLNLLQPPAPSWPEHSLTFRGLGGFHLQKLAFLLMAADYACEGYGLPSLRSNNDESYMASGRYEADLLLEPRELGSTLCRWIPPNKARVLPKAHTPPSGRTLRSLSHNLSYVEPDEGRPLWYTVPRLQKPPDKRCNILLVPHPENVPASCFRDRGRLREGTPQSFFSFQPPDTCGAAAHHICRLVDRANKEMQAEVNVVVLPESSLCAADYRLLRQLLLPREIILIAGLGGITQEGEEENRLALDVPLSSTYSVHLRQKKHHPWRIQRSQILQYSLANELDPSRTYWEKVRVGDRNTYFVALHPRILASVLVCEDLAQYEPVGRLIRAVGPDLVVAILLDGPQIGGRWPERYAAVLADDPGSSVLTLTCAGMCRRSRAISGADRSGIVALWKDPTGRREIELQPGASAVLLTLTIEEDNEEWTADLRCRKSTSLQFAQCLQVFAGDSHGDDLWADDGERSAVKYLSPVEASALARLARLMQESSNSKGSVEHWPRYYEDIAARIGPDSQPIALQIVRQMLRDSYGPLEDREVTQTMGAEERRQAEILAEFHVKWRELPMRHVDAADTAAEIIKWARTLQERNTVGAR